METRLMKPLLALVFLGMVIPGKTQTVLQDSLPQRWTYSRQFDQTLPTDDRWWDTFNDSTLNVLIAAGERNNYNVAIAARNLRTAQRVVKEARAGYFPTLTANAGYTKSRNTPQAFSLGAQMNWEIDIFGRISKNAEEAKAGVKVSQAEYAGTMVSMAANIAKIYFDLRTSQAVLEVMQQHVSSQEKIAHITQVRYDTGLSSMLDVSQALTVLYSTQASIPGVEAQIQTDINALATLTGLSADELQNMLEPPAPLPSCHQTVAIGTPADILRRRPDICRAEYTLASDAAAIGVAKKDFLPLLELTGSIGTASDKVGGLFGKNSLQWNIAPSLSWTIFDGLARNYRVQDAKDKLQSDIDSYNLTVATAVQEVNDGIVSYTSIINEIALLEKVMEQSATSLDLSLDLYKKGLTSFTDVMNSQITYLSNQSSLVSARGDALNALVTLYQALGGGY